MKYCDTCGTALVLGYCPRCREARGMDDEMRDTVEWAEVMDIAMKPKPVKWKGAPSEKCRQTVLLSGLDLLPGQGNLFETDGSESCLTMKSNSVRIDQTSQTN